MQGSYTGKTKIPLSPLVGASALGIEGESPERSEDLERKARPERERPNK